MPKLANLQVDKNNNNNSSNGYQGLAVNLPNPGSITDGLSKMTVPGLFIFKMNKNKINCSGGKMCNLKGNIRANKVLWDAKF